MATASAGAGAGGLPGQPPRRTRRSPGDRLRLRAGIGGRLRPVPERPPDGAGGGRPRRSAGARSRGREGAAHPRPHPGKPVRAGTGLVPGRTRTPSGSSPCAGTGTPTGWWSPRRRGPQRDSRISPPPGWSPSSTPTEAPAPSSRPPTTGTSRASASTGSSEGSTPSLPELRLRVGVYGHFAPVDWPQVFGGPEPTLDINPTTRR